MCADSKYQYGHNNDCNYWNDYFFRKRFLSDENYYLFLKHSIIWVIIIRLFMCKNLMFLIHGEVALRKSFLLNEKIIRSIDFFIDLSVNKFYVTAMNTFKNNLRRIRRAKDITQEQLSKLTGIHATQISQFERGRRKPNMDNLQSLAKYLECTLDELVN